MTLDASVSPLLLESPVSLWSLVVSGSPVTGVVNSARGRLGGGHPFNRNPGRYAIRKITRQNEAKNDQKPNT